jgi:caffeoyl-CoA O-methyltransferase
MTLGVGSKYTALDDETYGYLVDYGARQDDLLRELAAETAELGDFPAIMQVAPDQGALMTLLCRAIGARRALELGTFTGYSAICIARGLAEDGELITCDVNDEWAVIARRYFERAGLAERIDLRIGPALETLAQLPADEPFDFAFIDADKPNYPRYWEEVVRLLRPGGLAMVDNVLFGGSVVTGEVGEGRSADSPDAIRRTNELIAADERVDIAMLGIADGVTLALKR